MASPESCSSPPDSDTEHSKKVRNLFKKNINIFLSLSFRLLKKRSRVLVKPHVKDEGNAHANPQACTVTNTVYAALGLSHAEIR